MIENRRAFYGEDISARETNYQAWKHASVQQNRGWGSDGQRVQERPYGLTLSLHCHVYVKIAVGCGREMAPPPAESALRSFYRLLTIALIPAQDLVRHNTHNVMARREETQSRTARVVVEAFRNALHPKHALGTNKPTLKIGHM